MSKTSAETNKRRTWSLPDVDQSTDAIMYLHSRDRAPGKITLKFKLHTPGRWKTGKLLKAHEYVTNLKSQIFRDWHEDPNNARNDGALAQIQNIKEKIETELVQKRRVKSKDGQMTTPKQNSEQDPPKLRYLSGAVGELIRTRFRQAPDDPFRGRLREAVCRDCAATIMSWRQKQFKRAATALGKKQAEISVDDVRHVWQKQDTECRAAAATPIPFGRNKGQPLEKHGKREARWLFERMLPDRDIAELLKAVEILLDDEARVIQGQAGLTMHPWQRDLRHRRAVHERRILQRLFDQPSTTMRKSIMGSGD